MKSKLLLALLTSRSLQRHGRRGSVLLVGVLIALGLIVASAGAVWFLQGGKLSSLFGSDANSAQSVAEAGADQIIGVWNDPENRRLLVSGDAAPSTWTATNQTSPCLSVTNTRPGSNNGNPTTAALNLVDGNFRNLDDITQTATGDRRFRLKAVRYSTGAPGSTDRRTISRTYNTTSATATTTAGSYTATNFRDLINLDDPDGSGPLKPGINTGFIAVQVESQVYRNNVLVGTATVTKEYQVTPKCCGGSTGSNKTGGSQFSGTGSLGADSRYCGVEFGMVTGINGGKFWSYYANDTYNTINPSNGAQIAVRSILGLVTNASDTFQRDAATASGGRGCRVIPGPCSTSSDIYTSSGVTDASLYSSISTCTQCGTTSDKAGTSASGVPIIPLYISGGLPSVNSRFGYTWTASSRPATVFATSTSVTNNYPSFTSTGTATALRLRTNNQTPPKVEFCDATYAACNNNSWAQVSLPSGTTSQAISIADDFASNSFSGTTSGSVNRWPTNWVENDTSTGGAGVSAGNVQVSGGALKFQYTSGAPTWSTLTNRAAVARVVNLHALQSPYLSFTQTVTGLSGTAGTLEVSYSTTNAAVSTDTGWTQLMTTTATGTTTGIGATCSLSGSTYTCKVPIPSAAQTAYTSLRFRANSAFTTTPSPVQSVAVDNVQITDGSAGGTTVLIDNWCEYNANLPNTQQYQGGFHCLGPLINFALGGNFFVDTSGGSMNWYYNSSTDTRGTSKSSPLINMGNNAQLQHVNCPNTSPASSIPPSFAVPVTPSNACTTGIPLTVYSAVGENDMFNMFGRDTSPSGTDMQWVVIGSLSGTPGKISGVFFYMPWGAVYLIADQCDGTGSAATTYNFAGRVWSRYLIACGSNWFVVPPSSAINLAALGITSTINLADATFVGWTGSDWTANIATGSRLNSPL